MTAPRPVHFEITSRDVFKVLTPNRYTESQIGKMLGVDPSRLRPGRGEAQ